jgi:hypothetical protein
VDLRHDPAAGRVLQNPPSCAPVPAWRKPEGPPPPGSAAEWPGAALPAPWLCILIDVVIFSILASISFFLILNASISFFILFISFSSVILSAIVVALDNSSLNVASIFSAFSMFAAISLI